MQNRPQINTDYMEFRKPETDPTQNGVIAPPNSPAHSPKKHSNLNLFQAPRQEQPEPQIPPKINSLGQNA